MVDAGVQLILIFWTCACSSTTLRKSMLEYLPFIVALVSGSYGFANAGRMMLFLRRKKSPDAPYIVTAEVIQSQF